MVYNQLSTFLQQKRNIFLLFIFIFLKESLCERYTVYQTTGETTYGKSISFKINIADQKNVSDYILSHAFMSVVISVPKSDDCIKRIVIKS
jgi:hypothetical protein